MCRSVWTNTSPIIAKSFHKIKKKWTEISPFFLRGHIAMMDQKIKQDEIQIGANIRAIRKERGIGQTELVRQLQLNGVDMTRETLVKIERGIQHIQATQLRGIRDILKTNYDELLR